MQLPSHPRINRAALCNQVHAIGIVVGIRILCSTISTSEAKAISASYSLCTWMMRKCNEKVVQGNMLALLALHALAFKMKQSIAAMPESLGNWAHQEWLRRARSLPNTRGGRPRWPVPPRSWRHIRGHLGEAPPTSEATWVKRPLPRRPPEARVGANVFWPTPRRSMLT